MPKPTGPPCTICAEPCADTARICQRCTDRLARALGDVAALNDHSRHLAVELLTTRVRLGRCSDNGGRRSATSPLPFDWSAADMSWVLGNTLSTWARVLIDSGAGSCPAGGSPHLVAAWMLGHLELIRHHEAAAELVDEVTAAVWAVERAVDRPADRWYAGPCAGVLDEGEGRRSCDAELYATPGAEALICRRCAAVYDVAERRQFLLDAAEDSLAHAELIAQAVTALGQPLKSDRIRQWVHRKQLVVKGVDLHGRATYRVGDVLDLITEDARMAARREARQARRNADTSQCA